MPVREILQLGNPTLLEMCAPVSDPSSPEMRDLILDLDDTLTAFRETYGYGRGIAAPQIGSLHRLVFVRTVPDGFTGALINPKIVWADNRQVELWDACFSFPELLVRVSRAAAVHIEYTNEDGDRQTLEVEGGFSELLQHEIDHLDGIVAVQRAVSPGAFMTRAEWERQGQP